MVYDRRSGLSSYVSGLLSAGRTVFTAEEAEQALDVGRGAFLDAAERLQRRKALLNPRRGFYVVVPTAVCVLGGGHLLGTSTRSCAMKAKPITLGC